MSSIRCGNRGNQRLGHGWRGRWTRGTDDWRSGPWKRAALGTRLWWPGARQVLRRTCQRVHLLTGQLEERVHDAVTSLPLEAASVTELERL